MSGPENNENSTSMAKTGTLDLDNSQNDVKNDLKTCDRNLIELADESPDKISLITKEVPEEGATECLQKSMSGSNLSDNIVQESTEVNCEKTEVFEAIKTTSSHKSNHNDFDILSISTDLSINNKVPIENTIDNSKMQTNNIPTTEKESPEDHSSSIIDSPLQEAFSADKFDPKDQDSSEKIINSESICNQNMESTKDIKESVISTESANEFLNKECVQLESGELSQDNIVDVKQEQVQASEESQDLGKESLEDHLSSITESPLKEKFPADQFEPRAQDSSEKTANPETICNQNMESTKDIKESVMSTEYANELLNNVECVQLESGELSQDNIVDVKQEQVQASEESQDLEKESLEDQSSSITESTLKKAFPADQSEPRAQDSSEKTANPETIRNQHKESTKDIKESANELLNNVECVQLESGELSQDTIVDVKQEKVQASGESQDLEDGEVSDDDEESHEESPVKMPVCRFYIRNGCSWGNNCRFRHPGASRKGNYVMFENKVLPVVGNPFPHAWTPSLPTPALPFNLKNMNTSHYYSHDQPEIPKRSPLLPTPSFKDVLLAQKNYPNLGDLQLSVPNIDKPKPVVWQRRLTITAPGAASRQWSPPRIRSPSVSPRRHAPHEIVVEVRSRSTATLTSKPSVKRHRWPSPPQSSSTTVHGPRTPPCSPSKGSTSQSAPKRQRLYTYLSSSTDSSDSSRYTSTTESSDESSSSSDSDQDYRSKSSRRIHQKHYSRASEKSSSRTSTKCSSHRQEASVPKRTSGHTSKSKSRKHSSKTKKKSSKKTQEKDSPRVQSKVSKKSVFEGGRSYSSRREYLLMKLLQVEEQIAKKKKKMNMK